MDEDLPSTFDVVVIGTGLTESIVSAAVARNGHTVLHIDPRDYYGGKWATFAWSEWTMGSFAEKPKNIVTGTGTDGELVWTNGIREFEQVWYSDDINLREELTNFSRKFNIDIFPKVLMARESIIQLLIQSNVSRYLEFKCITKLMSSLQPPDDNQIEPIPISKSDIFTTKAISLVEKRCLMRFIEFVLKSNSSASTSNFVGESHSNNADNLSRGEPRSEDVPAPGTFEELAKKHKLSPKLKHFIQSAIRTMDDCNTIKMENQDNESNLNLDFMERCRLFLESIGRYGNQTPFLWTLYGISEICQAFCRLSAIYGGIFILKRPVESISKESETGMISIKTAGADIKTKHLVLSSELSLSHSVKENNPKNRDAITLVRGLMLVTGSRLKADLGDAGNLVVYRLDDTDVFELDETSLATTKNYRLLQVTCPFERFEPNSNLTPRAIVESKLKSFVVFPTPKPSETTKTEAETDSDKRDVLVQDSKDTTTSDHSENDNPLVLYGSYFFIDFHEDSGQPIHENIYSCATSSTELTDQMRKARNIFGKIYPEEEFLPKAPDAPEATNDNDDEDIGNEVPSAAMNGVQSEDENENIGEALQNPEDPPPAANQEGGDGFNQVRDGENINS